MRLFRAEIATLPCLAVTNHTLLAPLHTLTLSILESLDK